MRFVLAAVLHVSEDDRKRHTERKAGAGRGEKGRRKIYSSRGGVG